MKVATGVMFVVNVHKSKIYLARVLNLSVN